jgi:chromosome segregation ATPase
MADYNIDARLDRLTERHEALAQSLELTNRNLDRLNEKHEALTHTVELMAYGLLELQAESKATHKSLTDLAKLLGQLIPAMAANEDKLIQIAENHEQRLNALEGK